MTTLIAARFVAAMYHTCQAVIAKRTGDGTTAIGQIDRAMSISDWAHAVRREYGTIHARFNRNRHGAERAVQQALADDPYYINNLVNLAGIQIELGRYAEAEKHLKQALAINESLHLAHFAMGLIAAAQGQPDEARRAFERCLQLQPDFEPAKAELKRLPSPK